MSNICPVPTCQRPFPTEVSLERHRRRVHVPQRKHSERVECPRCPVSFKSRSLMGRHLRRVHAGSLAEYPVKTAAPELPVSVEGPYGPAIAYWCHACGSGFADRAELYAHQKQEHGVKIHPGRPKGSRNKPALELLPLPVSVPDAAVSAVDMLFVMRGERDSVRATFEAILKHMDQMIQRAERMVYKP